MSRVIDMAFRSEFCDSSIYQNIIVGLQPQYINTVYEYQESHAECNPYGFYCFWYS